MFLASPIQWWEGDRPRTQPVATEQSRRVVSLAEQFQSNLAFLRKGQDFYTV
jgi:hypothetical protein